MEYKRRTRGLSIRSLEKNFRATETKKDFFHALIEGVSTKNGPKTKPLGRRKSAPSKTGLVATQENGQLSATVSRFHSAESWQLSAGSLFNYPFPAFNLFHPPMFFLTPSSPKTVKAVGVRDKTYWIIASRSAAVRVDKVGVKKYSEADELVDKVAITW
ncbi:hypothetical protein Fot_19581 [Forsythia ovata]|uniref:Uncharacterized protein n=1 Tax=Forsythia ovata TaxID=205694 RepID=A0ABD1VP83_9LAMI